MSNIHKNLKKLRLEKGYTQEDIANKIGLSRQAVSSYELGRTRPDIDLLMQFAEIYGVELDAILYGKESNTKREKNLQLTAIIVFVLWFAFQLINILLLSIAEHVYPINIHAESLAELQHNDIHFQLCHIGSAFDQSALNILFFGCIILLLIHLTSKSAVSRNAYIKLIVITVTSSVFLILLDCLLLEDYAPNILVTLRFSWYIILAAFLFDIILQWIKTRYIHKPPKG